MSELPFWKDETSVLLKSLWGFTPETWGTLSFSNETRRNTLIKELSNPFVAVIYVTSNKSFIDSNLKNSVAGFYVVCHESGDRDEFTHPIHHSLKPERWRFGLRAVRAFSYCPEFRISIDQLDPTVRSEKRYRAVAKSGELIEDINKIDLLRSIPFEEVGVYLPVGLGARLPDVAEQQDSGQGLVQGGPNRSSGYFVGDSDVSRERFLYVLHLDGDTAAYLGEDSGGKLIYKIGHSISPDMRRQTFQRAMPDGIFRWKLNKSSAEDMGEAKLTFEAAQYAELQMKKYLAAKCKWLGGEFYLASESEIGEAWQIGCESALSQAVKLRG